MTAPISCDPVVSIQRSDAPDAVAGHLAWGRLMNRRLVACPGPLDVLSAASVPLVVLLASADLSGPGTVERIAIERADVLGLQEAPAGSVALLRLAYASRHKPQPRRVDQINLERKISSSPDIWTALEETGI